MCHDVQAVRPTRSTGSSQLVGSGGMDLNLSAVTRPVERLVATAQNGLEVLRLGGLETGNSPSPSQVVESVPMYKLRRYFPPDTRPGHPQAGAPGPLGHPMLKFADMLGGNR